MHELCAIAEDNDGHTQQPWLGRWLAELVKSCKKSVGVLKLTAVTRYLGNQFSPIQRQCTYNVQTNHIFSFNKYRQKKQNKNKKNVLLDANFTCAESDD